MSNEAGYSHSFVPPAHDATLVTPEQAAKRGLFERVAKMYGVQDEAASQGIDSLIVNLDALKALTSRLGYYYGMPPHRMPPDMVSELRKVGRSFLRGSETKGKPDRSLEAGLDIFKTIAVPLDSPDYSEWRDFLDKRTA